MLAAVRRRRLQCTSDALPQVAAFAAAVQRGYLAPILSGAEAMAASAAALDVTASNSLLAQVQRQGQSGERQGVSAAGAWGGVGGGAVVAALPPGSAAEIAAAAAAAGSLASFAPAAAPGPAAGLCNTGAGAAAAAATATSGDAGQEGEEEVARLVCGIMQAFVTCVEQLNDKVRVDLGGTVSRVGQRMS